MIVRNETAVLERCLASVRGLIDAWSICDTGSTDGTPQLVETVLADVPGRLHHRPWVDFGHNRSEAIRLAREHGDYLLLLDADMTITYRPGCAETLTAPSYLLRYDGDFEYWQKLLVSTAFDWHYVGSTHEYVMSSQTADEEKLPDIVVYHHEDGGSRSDKFVRDLELLTRDLDADPGDARTLFYLAQTLTALGRTRTAVELYERRAALGGWGEEVYYALYRAGSLRAEHGEIDAALMTLLRAWELRPTRGEALYAAVALLREQGLHRAAHALVLAGLALPRPDDTLFIERWIYDWGFLFEYSITAYWLGDARTALDACDRLLERDDLSEVHRAQTVVNREFCVAALDTLTALEPSL